MEIKWKLFQEIPWRLSSTHNESHKIIVAIQDLDSMTHVAVDTCSQGFAVRDSRPYNGAPPLPQINIHCLPCLLKGLTMVFHVLLVLDKGGPKS